MADKFTAKYEVADGYVSGSRPQSFSIKADEIDVSGMTDTQIEDMFYEMVEEDMRQKVSAESVNADEFVAWAKSLPSED